MQIISRYLVRLAPAVLAMAVLMLLGGCLLTLGAPLTRRVEPGKWTIEAGAGLTSASAEGKPGVESHLYVGRALGEHFELGLMPYGYSVLGGAAGAMYVPVKWDPFPTEWPVRWILHAGPIAFGGKVQGGVAAAGTGFSLELGRYVEPYITVSAVIPYVQFLSVAAGLRVNPSDRLSIGLNGFYANPGLAGAELNASVILGK